MKKSKAAVILVAILAAFAGLAYYASIILSSTGIGEEMSIPLGLDLSGGVSITYQVMDENPSAEDMSDTIYKLQKRVESYSTEAPYIRLEMIVSPLRSRVLRTQARFWKNLVIRFLRVPAFRWYRIYDG